MRLPARFFLTGAAVIAVSSCSPDRAAAPAGHPTVNGSSVLRALVVAQTVDFVIPSDGGSIDLLGAYTLSFPAGAVCDPDAEDTQTGYANHEWDADCTVATGDVAVRATLKWSNGKLYADFQPALRFAPHKRVILSTTVMASLVQSQADAGETNGWAIQYTAGIDQDGAFDALSDASLKTVVVGSTGKIFRQIKHFSGYYATTGEGYIPCDPSEANALCVWIDDEGFGGGGQH